MCEWGKPGALHDTDQMDIKWLCTLDFIWLRMIKRVCRKFNIMEMLTWYKLEDINAFVRGSSESVIMWCYESHHRKAAIPNISLGSQYWGNLSISMLTNCGGGVIFPVVWFIALRPRQNGPHFADDLEIHFLVGKLMNFAQYFTDVISPVPI